MTTWRCFIHNIYFSAESAIPGNANPSPVECFLCLREERNRLEAIAHRAQDERDALLRAIEIKRTAESP